MGTYVRQIPLLHQFTKQLSKTIACPSPRKRPPCILLNRIEIRLSAPSNKSAGVAKFYHAAVERARKARMLPYRNAERFNVRQYPLF